MKKVGVYFVMALFLASLVLADMSVQLKRTNPGVVGKTSAELIFDVVNTDMTHKIDGFLWCRSPDDATVSSSLGAGTGSGAQYVSPKFIMDVGPSQKSMSLTLEALSRGDKRADCTIKYIPYKEGTGEAETGVEEVAYDGEIGLEGTTVSGMVVKLVSYTETVEAVEAVEATETTEAVEAVEAVPAKVVIGVDAETAEIVVGETGKVGALDVVVVDARADGATVSITGTKTVTTKKEAVKQYLKMNGEYITEVTDSNYRELRLDKTVPFVDDMSQPGCPEGRSECKAEDVVELGPVTMKGNVNAWIIIAVVVLILVVVYLLGRTSKS